MEDELLELLKEARDKGANSEQLEDIAMEFYSASSPSKKKEQPEFLEPVPELVGQESTSKRSASGFQSPETSTSSATSEPKEPKPFIEQEQELADFIPKGDSGIDKYTMTTPEAIKNQEEKQGFWGNVGISGMANFNKAIASVPEALYSAGAWPGNRIAKALDLPEDHWLRNTPEDFKKSTGIKNPVLDWAREESEQLEKKKQKYVGENFSTDSAFEAFKKGEISEGFALVAKGGLESAPISLAIMASGGAFGLPATTAGTTLSLFEEQRQEIRELNPEMEESEVVSRAWFSSFAESALETVSAGTLGQVYKDILKKEGTEAGAKIFEKGVADMYKKMLKKYGAPAGAITEGIQEFATQVTQNLLAGKSALEGAVDAFLTGVGMGGAMSAPINVANVLEKSKIAKTVMDAETKKQISDMDNSVTVIDAELERNVSEEIANDLNEIKGELQAKKEEVIDGEFQKFKALPTAERKALGEMEKKLDDLKDQYEKIEESDMPTELKDELKKKKAKEAEEVYKKKKDIVEKAKPEPVAETTKEEIPKEEKTKPERKEHKLGTATFTAETDADGKVKIFNAKGKEIPEYTERKLKKGGTKKRKNPHYTKRYAIATGTITEFDAKKERDAKWNKVKETYTPGSAAEVAELAFADGAKVSRESIQKELGEKASELVWATGLTKETELPSIERMAEKLADDNPGLGFQSQDYRNAIIETLGNYNSVESIRDDYIERGQELEDMYAGLPEPEQVEAYKERMTDQEASILESVAFNEEIDNLSKEEQVKYFEDEYTKQIESLPETEQTDIYEQYELDQRESGVVQDIRDEPSDSKTSEVKEEKVVKKEPKAEKQSPIDEEIEYIEGQIEDLQEEITNQKQETKKDIAEVREKIAKVREKGKRKAPTNALTKEQAIKEVIDAVAKNGYGIPPRKQTQNWIARNINGPDSQLLKHLPEAERLRIANLTGRLYRDVAGEQPFESDGESLTREQVEDQIEELKAEIEDIKDENDAVLEGYKDDIRNNKTDIRRLNKEKAKEAKKAEPKIENTEKPAMKMTFPTLSNLRKAKNVSEVVSENNRIKEEYKDLKKILDCLWT